MFMQKKVKRNAAASELLSSHSFDVAENNSVIASAVGEYAH